MWVYAGVLQRVTGRLQRHRSRVAGTARDMGAIEPKLAQGRRCRVNETRRRELLQLQLRGGKYRGDAAHPDGEIVWHRRCCSSLGYTVRTNREAERTVKKAQRDTGVS